MPATRRPPGPRRRNGLRGRSAAVPVDRRDTTPMGTVGAADGAPRTRGPATLPLPAAGDGLPPGAEPPAGGPPPDDGARGGGPRRPEKLTVTRVAALRSRELTAAAVQKVRAASRADGAAESGLSQLLTVNALHMAGDAMIAVSLAGTLFFAAAADAQRGNVALYLLVTMAPFAVLAPLIGPVLDRLHRGRRWALAVSILGRAALALVLAAHHDDLFLYPAALGVLVLSKAHNVLRAAVVPRVLPAALPLTSANARLSVFGLVTAGVLGGLGAGVAALLGLTELLWAAAAVFVVTGVLALRLPRHVDVPAGEEPAVVLPSAAQLSGPRWRRRVVSPHVSTALRAQAALRGLAGFLTIFSAFLVQATFADGWAASLALGTVAAAAGVGSVVGTGIGSRLRTATPDRVVLVSAGLAAAITVAAAVFYSVATAAVVVAVAAVTNALGKVALDAIIQREVPDRLRASAFARSETVLQLSWVIGGAVGIVLPPTGWLGFTVAAALLALAVGLVLYGVLRGRSRAPEPAAEGPRS
ncbi:MFS transporter [Geodermatophilus sp. YIM 151500]|uniref:MFS transporter n=1 Tax=Geodermatophilus sp. YIM 151500 TaxID=2984531 RepID=UPI0021E4FE8B|nr:MFS transporter [Geodermatophilus sp. YIM 151500]MCV2489650.1 MFS transporter [Geodermatophilus sp. YIM 151500]